MDWNRQYLNLDVREKKKVKKKEEEKIHSDISSTLVVQENNWIENETWVGDLKSEEDYEN